MSDGDRQRHQPGRRGQHEHCQCRQPGHQRQLHPDGRRSGDVQGAASVSPASASRVGSVSARVKTNAARATPSPIGQLPRNAARWRGAPAINQPAISAAANMPNAVRRSWPRQAQSRPISSVAAASPVSASTDTGGGTAPKPAGKHEPAREHTQPSGRRGHQAGPQEASQHGEPERHTECDQRSVEMLPVSDMDRHPGCVTRRQSARQAGVPPDDRGCSRERKSPADAGLGRAHSPVPLGDRRSARLSWLTESRGWMELHFLSGYSMHHVAAVPRGMGRSSAARRRASRTS